MLSKKRVMRERGPAFVTSDNASPVQLAPERLVGKGFRYWMAGYQTGDIGCWEEAWRIYSSALGGGQAKSATTELACWVRAIQNCATRPIEIFPGQCRGFCRDECVAISMVAAAQHDVCPAMRACAYALLGSSAVDEVVDSTGCLAARLKDCNQVLSVGVICNVTAITTTHRPHELN